jgi:hypothetical protein
MEFLPSLDALMFVCGAGYFYYRLIHLPKGSLLPPQPEENALVQVKEGGTAACPKCNRTGYIPMGLKKQIRVGDKVRAWLFYPRGLCYQCFGDRSSKMFMKELGVAVAIFFCAF